MRTTAGYFFMQKKFDKPAFSSLQFINLLKQRGLKITDVNSAIQCLNSVGYYRLSGYFKPYQISDREDFQQNVNFNNIWSLYIFDSKLRSLVTDAIEIIEVAFRVAISNYMSITYGSHWYRDKELFKKNNFHAFFMEQVNEIYEEKRRIIFKTLL